MTKKRLVIASIILGTGVAAYALLVVNALRFIGKEL